MRRLPIIHANCRFCFKIVATKMSGYVSVNSLTRSKRPIMMHAVTGFEYKIHINNDIVCIKTHLETTDRRIEKEP